MKGEISSITNIATTAALSTEVNGVKGRISSSTKIAISTALTVV